MKNYLTHNEIKENSIIVIDFESGTSSPYFVSQISIGAVTGATMLLGYGLSRLIVRPDLYPCSKTGGTDRYYIANKNTKGGSNEEVNGYRRLQKEERNEWIEKIKLADERLHPLIEILSEC